MSTLIRLLCEDQKLSYKTKPIIASGSHEASRVSFEFSEEWNGYLATAVFYRLVEDQYHVVLDKSYECDIPSEVLLDPGAFYIGVFGTKDGDTRTSSLVVCNVERGAIISVGRVPDPTPDVYSQIVSMIEAGMLKGDPGVYVGGGEMPEGYYIQIDPDGTEVTGLVTSVNGQTPDESGNIELKISDVDNEKVNEAYNLAASASLKADNAISTANQALSAIPTEGLLPDVTSSDEGKVLTVVGGRWVAKEVEEYDGELEVV